MKPEQLLKIIHTNVTETYSTFSPEKITEITKKIFQDYLNYEKYLEIFKKTEPENAKNILSRITKILEISQNEEIDPRLKDLSKNIIKKLKNSSIEEIIEDYTNQGTFQTHKNYQKNKDQFRNEYTKDYFKSKETSENIVLLQINIDSIKDNESLEAKINSEINDILNQKEKFKLNIDDSYFYNDNENWYIGLKINKKESVNNSTIKLFKTIKNKLNEKILKETNSNILGAYIENEEYFRSKENLGKTIRYLEITDNNRTLKRFETEIEQYDQFYKVLNKLIKEYSKEIYIQNLRYSSKTYTIDNSKNIKIFTKEIDNLIDPRLKQILGNNSYNTFLREVSAYVLLTNNQTESISKSLEEEFGIKTLKEFYKKQTIQQKERKLTQIKKIRNEIYN